MKTIEQAANEFVNNLRRCSTQSTLEYAFEIGVKFAQRWISVNEELPKPDTDVIVKFTIVQGCFGYALAEYSDDCIWHWRGDDFKQPQNITDWRPIELE